MVCADVAQIQTGGQWSQQLYAIQHVAQVVFILGSDRPIRRSQRTSTHTFNGSRMAFDPNVRLPLLGYQANGSYQNSGSEITAENKNKKKIADDSKEDCSTADSASGKKSPDEKQMKVLEANWLKESNAAITHFSILENIAGHFFDDKTPYDNSYVAREYFAEEIVVQLEHKNNRVYQDIKTSVVAVMSFTKLLPDTLKNYPLSEKSQKIANHLNKIKLFSLQITGKTDPYEFSKDVEAVLDLYDQLPSAEKVRVAVRAASLVDNKNDFCLIM
jgi:hypothetical protein